MRVVISHRTGPAGSYRAARVKSLFNATDEQACRFDLTVDLPLEDRPWRIGVVVGPSGSGKSSIGERIWGPECVYSEPEWGPGPIIDHIAPAVPLDAVTAALGSVGLGDVPTWLRPYGVLSTGQKFRADLARIIAEAPDRVVIDEFTSVVDRQIAQVGAGAFAKAWRRTGGSAVLLSCHYDVLDWLQPDWVLDTASRKFTWGWQRPRPTIDLEIRLGGWDLWPLFKPHHYLEAGPMPFGKAYVGFVDGEPVAHLGMSSRSVTLPGGRLGIEARACRMVIMPEWQGAGVGMKMLNECCRLQYAGHGVRSGRKLTTVFHTSHPGLIAALTRDPRWRCVSRQTVGGNKARSKASMSMSSNRTHLGYGGHLRGVTGFRYYGPRPGDGPEGGGPWPQR